uniref:Uncharacterized protein n=1 Tax=Escherichia phage PMBT16 TaxID=3137282 RepID=A0AAU8BTA3_9VIRU
MYSTTTSSIFRIKNPRPCQRAYLAQYVDHVASRR